jgi:hypothetical protein
VAVVLVPLGHQLLELGLELTEVRVLRGSRVFRLSGVGLPLTGHLRLRPTKIKTITISLRGRLLSLRHQVLVLGHERVASRLLLLVHVVHRIRDNY